MLLEYYKYVACPNCKGDLTLNAKELNGEWVKDGELHCAACHVSFLIRDEIPRFASDLGKVEKHTARSFGYKWRQFDTIDQYTKKNFLDELFPLDYTTFFKGKRILDAGTGIGIPCNCIAAHGAREVYAIDINESIAIAKENNRKFRNVSIAQADIYHMPFKRNFFDVVVCVAVLQHLIDPPKAFDELFSYLKPGGTIILWVYAKEGNNIVRLFIEPARKTITRRLPLNMLLILSYVLCVIFQSTIKFIYKPLSRLGIKWLPLNDYIVYRSNFNFKTNTQMIFDQLLAPLSYLFRKEEVERFFDHPEVDEYILRHHNKNSWTAIGTKKNY